MPAVALVRLSAVLALVLAAALPARADEPAPRSEFEVTPLPPVGSTPAPVSADAAAAPAPAEAPTDDAATAVAPDAAGEPPADVATLPEAPPPLEGPLRPKGTLPDRVEKEEPGWNRSFGGGVKWTKGDTTVTLSGSRSSVRLGTTISR